MNKFFNKCNKVIDKRKKKIQKKSARMLYIGVQAEHWKEREKEKEKEYKYLTLADATTMTFVIEGSARRR